MGGLQSAQDVLAGASAGVDGPEGTQVVEVLSIEVDAGALIVGGERTANVRAFIPGKAEPFQILNEAVDEFRANAGAIEVFVAQNELAGGGPGAFLGDPESAGVAEMDIAGGRRSEAAAIPFGVGLGALAGRVGIHNGQIWLIK